MQSKNSKGISGGTTPVGVTKDTMSPSAKLTLNRSVKPFNHDVVRADDTTNEERRSGAFCHSGQRVANSLKSVHGVQPGKNSHTTNGGLDTLASDSRTDPLAGSDIGLDFPNAKNTANVRITETGDFNTPSFNKSKGDPKGNVVGQKRKISNEM